MKRKYILFIVVFCLAASMIYAVDKEKTVFNQFLYPKNLIEMQKAFNLIVTNEQNYKELVIGELEKCVTRPNKTPDALIYLAALLRDQRYVQPLAKLIKNADYSENRCIYSCPIVFSLAIFSSFSNYPLPVFDDNLSAVYDLKSETERIKKISMAPEEASKYLTGPAVDITLKKMETLPLAMVIKKAGPTTKDVNERLAAAVVLQSHVTNDKYLKELYWLAIADVPNDASGEYRFSIHWAIYRAETYRKLKKL
jgi:hypothetical protein